LHPRLSAPHTLPPPCPSLSSLDSHGAPRALHSFPTRRSSDLVSRLTEPYCGPMSFQMRPNGTQFRASAGLCSEGAQRAFVAAIWFRTDSGKKALSLKMANDPTGEISRRDEPRI